MAKYLKDVLKGVKSSTKVTNDLGGYKPKAGDEQDFVKKHEIEKHADRVGNGDDVYKGTTKHVLANTKEKNHGYKKPEDAKVNEEQIDEAGMPASVIKSKQNRANMNDKQFADSHKNHSDADLRSMAWRHGFGKPGTPGHNHYVNRRNKGLKEEVQIDELSTDLLHRAAHKAAKKAMTDVQGRSGPIFKKRAAQANKFRAKGMEQEKKEKAVKEEAEQIDELSKKTLGNYAHAGVRDIASRQYALGKGDKSNTGKLMNRRKGVDKAISKLSKEEVEQVDELSKTTLGNYVKSASADVGHKKADAAYSNMSGDDKQADKNTLKARKRLGGIYTAVNKLSKEEVEQIDEISAKLALKTAVKRKAGAYGAAIERGDELSDKEENKVNKSQNLIKNKYGQRGVNIVDKAVGKKIGYEEETVEEGAKVDRMVAHIKSSEKSSGKSDKKAEDIAWATANKRGMLDNKNKK